MAHWPDSEQQDHQIQVRSLRSLTLGGRVVCDMFSPAQGVSILAVAVSFYLA